ncbi:MAG: Thioredoxin reductase [Cyanobacteria bacterium RYN_339]|nr:Thioredoxin reductase [Cyanobacteria bacterium RYN_339]
MPHQVIIIGAGPAGYTAGVYAARANMSPVLFEGSTPGGQLMITTDVENYPGFPESVTGPELMVNFRKQAERFGTTIITDVIKRTDFSSRPFKVWDSKDQLHEAHSIIIATGAEASWLGLESEKTLAGRGVSACATCDGFFFRGKTVAVVGGGDTAMEEANFLANMCQKVYVVHRRDTLRASKIMQQRALDNPKIEFCWNSSVHEIEARGNETVTHAILKDTNTGELRDLTIDGIFIAIGHKPNTGIFGGQLKLDENNYIVTEPGSTRTSIDGVFAAGDVQDSIYRQAVTAAGTGCMAAIEAERWLSHHGVETHSVESEIYRLA